MTNSSGRPDKAEARSRHISTISKSFDSQGFRFPEPSASTSRNAVSLENNIFLPAEEELLDSLVVSEPSPVENRSFFDTFLKSTYAQLMHV